MLEVTKKHPVLSTRNEIATIPVYFMVTVRPCIFAYIVDWHVIFEN
jgi:hypothetical protein